MRYTVCKTGHTARSGLWSKPCRIPRSVRNHERTVRATRPIPQCVKSAPSRTRQSKRRLFHRGQGVSLLGLNDSYAHDRIADAQRLSGGSAPIGAWQGALAQAMMVASGQTPPNMGALTIRKGSWRLSRAEARGGQGESPHHRRLSTLGPEDRCSSQGVL